MSNVEIKPIARECRFAIHVPERYGRTVDTHIVKEQVHYSDGTIKPELRFLENVEREVYVTKPSKRCYNDKREWESLDDLLVKKTTQSKMRDVVAKLLDRSWSKDHMKKLAQSQYLYGTDISSTSLIKKKYQDRFPDHNTPFSLCTFDVETDVVNGTDEVIMASVIFKQDVFIAVKRDFVGGFANLETIFQNKCQELIGNYLVKNNQRVTLHVADDVVDLIKACFTRIHQHKPDWLAIWNMDYDVPKVLAMLKKYNVDPIDVLCDPEIPRELRVCEYKEGTKKKTTASGKVQSINPAAQWHTLKLTASFYVIDSMCAYKHLRLGEQEESSYSLDYILDKRLGIRKLKFEEAERYTGLRKHQFLQTHFKLEYMVYNIFDSLSMLELDAVTKDLAFTLPTFSATSDFSNFKSQPKRIVDALHFYALEQGYVLGTVGSSVDYNKPTDENGDEIEEDTDDVLSLQDWILTLPPHHAVLGIRCILEDPSMQTGIRGYVYDSDATAAYPSSTSVANVSKSTTKKEIISIEGIDEETFRAQNLNLVLGHVNALEYCQTMFNMPKPEMLLQLYGNGKNNG